MKKHAFSLIEVLVALGIVGVISVLLVQAISNARPDATKVAYLKAYDGLRETVAALANDSSIYGNTYTSGSSTYNISDFPLLDYSQPSNSLYSTDNNFSGEYKLCYLLKDIFHGTTSAEQQECKETDDSKYNFTTPQNGIQWKIPPLANPLSKSPTGNITFQQDVWIRIPVKNGTLQEFRFYITADGNVFVNPDEKNTNRELGWYYIKTRHNLKSTTIPSDFLTQNPCPTVVNRTLKIDSDIVQSSQQTYNE